ncbi:SH3 domain-containing protein [Prosthecomicrobium pneumaticum]|uniref:Uncharacterized protein YraI n=1 Tax=Prosthecomicrobium pneumaticum TaxID=81895 RepID=A0A7W9FMR1_9HYPH|nr:SH3 domain-containing protein [Prosthecomicrobium pneumaticum]MBB5753538.1 uncharacterized protein YraI [Prosthecomicrobium pneumaticum]
MLVRRLFLSLFLMFTGIGTAEAAVRAVAVTDVNLRAGPSVGYPVVTTLPAGARVTAYGCVRGATWCDVGFAGWRGWVAAAYLEVLYRGRPVVLGPAVAPAVGIVTVDFSRAYWDRYYVGRPWYGDWPRYNTAPRVRGGVVCNDERCRYGYVVRGPHGGRWVRHGTIIRD